LYENFAFSLLDTCKFVSTLFLKVFRAGTLSSIDIECDYLLPIS
jgi:hypothetical protein